MPNGLKIPLLTSEHRLTLGVSLPQPKRFRGKTKNVQGETVWSTRCTNRGLSPWRLPRKIKRSSDSRRREHINNPLAYRKPNSVKTSARADFEASMMLATLCLGPPPRSYRVCLRHPEPEKQTGLWYRPAPILCGVTDLLRVLRRAAGGGSKYISKVSERRMGSGHGIENEDRDWGRGSINEQGQYYIHKKGPFAATVHTAGAIKQRLSQLRNSLRVKLHFRRLVSRKKKNAPTRFYSNAEIALSRREHGV